MPLSTDALLLSIVLMLMGILFELSGAGDPYVFAFPGLGIAGIAMLRSIAVAMES